MRRFVAILGVVAILAFAVGPVMAKGDEQRPFKGVAQGHGMVVLDPECLTLGLRSVFTTAGQATHMGAFALDFNHCTPAGPYLVGTEMTFVAANGDEVYATYTAGPFPVVGEDPEVFDAPVDFVIVGGSGRFEGASGGGHITLTVSWPGFEPNYWPATLVFEGTIGY